MISAIGSTGSPRAVQLPGDAAVRSDPVTRVTSAGSKAAKAPVTPAADMAAAGAPVDTDKVAALRAQIAAGRYQIDPKAIADRMIALDIPLTK